MTPRPRKYALPPGLTYDSATGRYRYTDPITGKRPYVGRDRAKAIERAKKLNALAELHQAGGAGNNVEAVVNRYTQTRLPHMPWDDGTRANHLYKLRRFKRDFAGRDFRSLGRKELGGWLDSARTADTYMKYRGVLVSLWEWAISENILDFNEAAATLKRSTSRKLAANKKRRTRLEVEQFWQIHDAAEGWLQRAMRLSLVTLQARAEIISMRFSDARDGFLYVIRDKTAHESEMAFIRIAWNDTLEQIWGEARQSKLACPYVIHRKPTRHRARREQNKQHHFAVTPDYLSKAFAKVRDDIAKAEGRHWQPGEAPTFHEIRSLGGRLYRRQGFEKAYVQALMTHTDPKTTTVYLENPEQLEDRHYRTVGAGLVIKR